MASTAIDVEQGSLNQRAVDTQASSEFENEKVGFVDDQSSSGEKPGKAWRPEDA